MCFGGGSSSTPAPVETAEPVEAPPATEPTKFDYDAPQQDSAKLSQQKTAATILSTTDPDEPNNGYQTFGG